MTRRNTSRLSAALREELFSPPPTPIEEAYSEAIFMNQRFDEDVKQAARMFSVKPWHPSGTTSEMLLERHLTWIRDRYTQAIAHNRRTNQ